MKSNSPYIHLVGNNLLVNTIEFCKCHCDASNGYDCWLKKFRPLGPSKSIEFIGQSECLAPNCWSICEIKRLACINAVLEYFNEEVLITDADSIAGHTWRFVLKVKDNDWEDVEVVGLWVDSGSWLIGSFSWYDLAWCAKQKTTNFVTWSVWRKLFQEGFIY